MVHAVVLHGAGDVRVEERTLEAPGEGVAQILVALGGICGSDISYYKHGAVGAYKVTAPMILGHEVVGTVGDLGAGPSIFDSGDRVAVDPSSPCQRCERCLEGRSNICLDPSFLGSASTQPHTDGGFSSTLLASRANLVPIAAHLDDRLAVFAEPLAVTVHALARSGGVRGARVLVVGAGPIGGMLIALAKQEGAAEVVAADVESERLAIALSLGADRSVLVGQEDVGTAYDVVFDASGVASAIGDSLTRVRRGGRLVLVGLPHAGPVPMPTNLAVTGEVDIVGSFRFNHSEFELAVQHLAEGLDLRPLISNRYDARDAGDAFVEAASGKAMKVHLHFAHTG